MALVAITPVALTTPRAGAVKEAAEKALDATEHNSFVNDGQSLLVVRNKDAAATHTVKLLNAASGAQIGPTVTVGKSKTVVLGPFASFEYFGQTVRVDADSAELTAVVVTVPGSATAER